MSDYPESEPPVAPAPDFPAPPAHVDPAPPVPAPVPKERAPRGILAIVVAAIAGGIVGAVLVGVLLIVVLGYPVSQTITEVPQPVTTTVSDTASVGASGQDASFAEAVATKLTPSVVNVAIKQTGVDRFTGQQVTQTVGNGSGVIIRQDGYILTNNHVVEGADAIIVTVGMEDLPAKVVGTDPSSDLAVIKVDKTGLPAAEFGSSANLKIGEPVVAIGSPFGLEKTVTTGIVSALGRSSVAQSASGITAYTSLIQTDASINPGNSGGALADADGKLIGINTLIQSTSGASAGIGFAIPVDFAKSVADELIATGRATHPFMGVGTVTIDANVAAQYGLATEAGALVQNVVEGSPAQTGGLKAGDIIVRIADKKILSVEDVFTAIRSQKVDQIIDVLIVRADGEMTLRVKLGSDAARQ
ncbi:MAG: trypsin-like peptidase domain-containing protein [Actinomycetota bacterium]|nr:trypsin-like peptidase domain-containing protein [Actinomycetota bacterium]